MNQLRRHEDYMRRAIELGMRVPELPFGAVIVDRHTGAIVAEGDRLPEYLRPEVQSIIRPRLDRVEVRTTSLEDALASLPSRSVDAFYLSDVFELSTPAGHAATLAEVARVGRPGARVCYWNNLVPRRHPDQLSARLADHPVEADRLEATDRAFLYSRLVVESVRGTPA